MCRFLAAGLGFVFMLFSTIAAMYGLVSMNWYAGEATVNGMATYVSIGIPSGCSSTLTLGGVAFCTGFEWDALVGTAEKAMAGMLLAAFVAGVAALVLLVLTLMTCGCCLPVSGPVVALCAGVQCVLVMATCLTMAAHYGWAAPHGLPMGPAYVLNIAGSVLAFLSVFFVTAHHVRSSRSQKHIA